MLFNRTLVAGNDGNYTSHEIGHGASQVHGDQGTAPTAGWGPCLCGGCSGFVEDGNGGCNTCGCSFGRHT
jgi:hypothetical protein